MSRIRNPSNVMQFANGMSEIRKYITLTENINLDSCRFYCITGVVGEAINIFEHSIGNSVTVNMYQYQQSLVCRMAAMK